MMKIAKNAWEQSRRYFNEDECCELQSATLHATDTPRGFAIDEAALSDVTRAKVRFHFLEKTGRVARGAAL